MAQFIKWIGHDDLKDQSLTFDVNDTYDITDSVRSDWNRECGFDYLLHGRSIGKGPQFGPPCLM